MKCPFELSPLLPAGDPAAPGRDHGPAWPLRRVGLPCAHSVALAQLWFLQQISWCLPKVHPSVRRAHAAHLQHSTLERSRESACKKRALRRTRPAERSSEHGTHPQRSRMEAYENSIPATATKAVVDLR
jgi:hypothetical protein